ncbi:MAG: tryptophan-rich sensory protein [Sedimentisphaerales bacterium]|nr:tryptophan-rich sensory protein [Sedimentisphaerales bacterium]
MKFRNLTKLIVCCAVPFAVGLFGSLFTTADSLGNWYANLNKPFFNPPNWIFGPVWTTLYIMMGVSAFLVWQKGLDGKPVRIGVICFVVQLALNAVWTPLFFGLRSPLLGLIDIILLLAAIIVTIFSFFKISIPAGLLLIPYFLWVSFATILNASLYILNR